jgi:hypothetical protein
MGVRRVSLAARELDGSAVISGIAQDTEKRFVDVIRADQHACASTWSNCSKSVLSRRREARTPNRTVVEWRLARSPGRN